MNRYCLTLDLIDDPGLIAEYEDWHQKVWPEVLQSIRDAGILQMEIYRSGNRLCMLMETGKNFSAAGKAAQDALNPKVQEWEQLMNKFQQPLAWAREGEKWVVMNKIFSLTEAN